MVLDDDEDEDDGEIKQESNRAHPSDGATKSDNTEHEVHKCMDCGKVYKHPNCLWKHRWEHSTYWKVKQQRDIFLKRYAGCFFSLSVLTPITRF